MDASREDPPDVRPVGVGQGRRAGAGGAVPRWGFLVIAEAATLGGLGMLVGSFIGLVSLRLPRGEDVVRGRSRCGGCGRPLPPWRMVPVFGWLAVQGRASCCGSAIPARYPVVEAGAGLIGVWAALGQTSWTAAALTALFGWQLLLIAIVDAEHFQLPDALTAPLFLTGLLAAALSGPDALRDAGIGAAAGALGLWGLGRLYRLVRDREGLGGGDPLLLGAIGAWTGWIGLPGVLVWASAAGLSMALARGLVRGGLSGSDRVPFGVFLALGAWLVLLYGPLPLA